MEIKEYIRPRFKKLTPNQYMDFWNSLKDAKLTNEHGDFVLLRDPELYKDTQNFLLGHGIAGFAINNMELISIHKNNEKAKQSKVQHILPKMVRCAFKYGAIFGDCYGEFLADYYMRSGFIVIAKLTFEEVEDNPITWNYEKFGKPNVYILMRGVRNIEELDKLRKNNELHGFDDISEYIPTLKNIDEADIYRANIYEKIKRMGYKKRFEYIKNLYINK